jgi:hypothetical protein
VLYWDKDTKGFGLRVTPTGLSKFIAQGRVRGTTTDVRVTIGSYGAWTVDAARRKADEYRHLFERGIDPREVAREQKAMQVTLQEVSDAYLSRPGKLKARTAAEYRRHVDQVFAVWRNKPITSITREMVKERHGELILRGLDGKKAAPATANAAMVTLRILFNFAADEYRRPDGTPLIAHNPVGALKHHWAKLGNRTVRSLLARVAQLEKAEVPAVSPFERAYGSVEAFVAAALAGIDTGTLDPRDGSYLCDAVVRWHVGRLWDASQ